MALIDVSELINDPCFCDDAMVELCNESIDDYGMNSQVCTPPINDRFVFQDTTADDYIRFISHTFVANSVTVYAKGAYFDDISVAYLTWRGKRWVLKVVAEDYRNHGMGYQKCLFVLDEKNA
jgi:hypothetical protein